MITKSSTQLLKFVTKIKNIYHYNQVIVSMINLKFFIDVLKISKINNTKKYGDFNKKKL